MKQFLTVFMVLVFATTALAQGQAGRGGGGGVMGLLSMAEVQRELNLKDAQKKTFQALRGGRGGGGQQNLSREERQQRTREQAQKIEEAIKTALDEQQQQRLSELRIQREGASALARDDVAAKLELDETQKEQISRIQADNAPADRSGLQNATQEERRRRMTELREQRQKTNAALMAVLTTAQKEAFEKMHGEKFTFPQQQQQGRRQQ